MNNIKEKIIEILPNAVFDEDINLIMEIIEEYLEEAFDAAKDYKYLSCGGYEDIYSFWKEWYDIEVNI